ncbi:DoxX family protein [Flavobacterium notoginsengisoli]|uniref:DoxX family protein n=1 Tax=Flavobacterium notoginsengisoli TaxID=1478199 RepID=UPI0036371AAA
MSNKGITIVYWVTTIFVAFVGLAGILNILQLESLVKVNRELGLPQYLMPFLGTVKVLGAIAILIPALKKLHEAAYFGFIFYFIGATYVLICNGGGIDKFGVTIVIVAFTIVSYLTFLKRKKNVIPKQYIKT